MLIGNKLRTLRTSKGFSTQDVAEKLGTSVSTYGRYERNETFPDIKFIENVASLYEMQIADLLTDDKVALNFQQQGGTYNNGYIFNQLSEKLVENLEKRIEDKDFIIEGKNLIIEQLQNKIKQLENKK